MRFLIISILLVSSANCPFACAVAPTLPVAANKELPQSVKSEPVEKEGISWRSPDTVKANKLPVDRPMLLFFTTKGCSYCVKMNRETWSHRDVIRQVSEKYTALKVDGAKYEKLIRKLGVRVFPTTAIVQPDGKVVDVMPGFHGPAEFMKRLETANARMAKVERTVAAKPPITVKK